MIKKKIMMKLLKIYKNKFRIQKNKLKKKNNKFKYNHIFNNKKNSQNMNIVNHKINMWINFMNKLIILMNKELNK